MTAFAADTLEQLFSYGTLQRETVQIATFGRRLHGRVDKLPRFAMSQVEIDDAEVVKTSSQAPGCAPLMTASAYSGPT